MEIHSAWLVAVHVHSRDTPTLSVPLPPPGPKVVVEPVRLSWHLVFVLGAVTLVVLEPPHAASANATDKLNSSDETLPQITAHRACTSFARAPQRICTCENEVVH